MELVTSVTHLKILSQNISEKMKVPEFKSSPGFLRQLSGHLSGIIMH